MKSTFLFLFILTSSIVFGQSEGIMGGKDTLKFDYTIGGKLDSIDISLSQMSSTLPGGGIGSQESILPYNFFVTNPGGALYRNFSNWKKMRFSALPHLGFSYIFGRQATQIVRLMYTHTFSEKFSLNLDYDMHKGNSFMRNTAFAHNDVQLRLQYEGSLYSFQVRSQFQNHSIGHSGGILTDSLIDINGLGLSPVRKDNALSTFKGVRLEMDHYLDFLSKDSLNAMGLYLEHQLKIQNRRFIETSDTLSIIYSTINIDSNSTHDQAQTSAFNNVAGLYYEREGFYFKAGLQANYWRYMNYGSTQNRTEINLDGKLGLDIRGISIKNHSNINLIAAQGEWFTNSTIKFAFRKIDVAGYVNISQLLPEPFQRSYFANNLSYSTSFENLKKQFRMDVNGALTYTEGRHKVAVFAKNAVASNNYWFKDGQWKNDTLTTLNALSLGISGKTSFKALHFAASVQYNASNWMPTMLAQGRLYVQGRILKGRKLLAQFGVEPSFHTGYKLIESAPLMDIFQLTEFTSSPMANLHVFMGLEVQRFRFFVRVEHLGSLWNESTTRIALGQPIPQLHFRIGITWDFFN